MLEEKIQLSGIEQAAYWWTNRLMYMTRHFALRYERILGPVTHDESKFLSIFYNYTDKEWRDLYLKLKESILEDVNNYKPQRNVFGLDSFSQDTEKGRHGQLNIELAKITGVADFPDIRLADSSSKDEVIYTSKSESRAYYKSCGIRSLNYLYRPTYIISGNEQELNLYNHLLATFVALNREKFAPINTDLFRQCLCETFIEQNALKEDIKAIQELFNKCYNIANERNIVLGNCWDKTFFIQTLRFDGAGLNNECIEHGVNYGDIYLTQVQSLESKQQTSVQNDEDEMDK